MRRLAVVSLVVLSCASGAAVWAQEAPTPGAPADVKELIQQLDADKFTDRQAASQRLSDAGKAAIPALVEAAASPSREASSRSIDILKKHSQSQDEATKKAAREALEKLAKSDDSRVAAAAAQALKPKDDPNVPAVGGLVPGIQIGGGQVQIQVQAIAGGNVNRRVGIQNVNGVKTTTVEENGRKVKIVEDPQNGIKMEVTEKVDGKEETKKYEAKDADDLKKNHPEAHKIYEQSTKQQNVQIQIGGGAIPALPLAPGIAPRAIPVLPGFRNPAQMRAVQEQLERVQKELKDAEQRLKKAAENSPQADELGKSVQQLEEARKQLEEAIEKVKTP